MLRIGVDTGGTFTDFVFYKNGKFSILKIPSTPHDPSRAVIEGLKGFIGKPFILIHGTTVATNAFLEGKLAKTAFLTTEGFEHLLHIARQNRINLFSLKPEKPPSLVPLNLCFGLKERTLADGRIEKDLEEQELKVLAETFRRMEIEAVAVLFLHSYANPENERKAASFFRKKGFFVSASCEVLPEYREYERAVVTVLNASLMPVMEGYIRKLSSELGKAKFFIMQSSGGFLAPEIAAHQPVRTILSGPAGGAIAAVFMGRKTGFRKLITLDMGGTSTDVTLIDGDVKITKEAQLAHLPLRIPVLDIQTVGAGGGSIARVDAAGALRVGPESAGAKPGPACYGESDYATVTDAFVVLGLIPPELFLGGKMKIYPERSFVAIEALAHKIGKDVKETAWGIVEVALASMERALRAVSIERGYDPREFVLFPFGGAGGLVAVELAARLQMRKILVPSYQGVFSALGMVFADSVKELSKAFMKKASPDSFADMQKEFQSLQEEAKKMLMAEGFEEGDMVFLRSLDMRYYGQSYELNVAFSRDFIEAFHREHQRVYSHFYENREVEVVNLRLRAVGKVKGLDLKPVDEKRNSVEEAFFAERTIYYRGQELKAKIYLREKLFPGAELAGPAIVSAMDSTTFIPPGFRARVDRYLNLLVDRP